MSTILRAKNSNSTFCINDNLINEKICVKSTELFEKKSKNGLDESTIIWLLENCECEKTRDKLNNLLNNHIQKVVAINEAMKMYLGLNANEATVLGAMYIPTAKSGRGYLSNKMIMHSTGLSRRTVQYALRKFEKLGLIETVCKRDSINKMKVTRNYTFTNEFYNIAKATGCYTIQTPEKVGSVEPSELHEMSTKPIGMQVQNLHIKNNNIYTSISTSNYTKLLVDNKRVNIYKKVNSKLEPIKESSKKEMIVNKSYNRASYDQIIKKFVRRSYKESSNTIIKLCKEMLKVWYGSYKNKSQTKLKLKNFELINKLNKLKDLSQCNSAIAVAILNQSIKNHYSDFYAINIRDAIAYKDKVINGVIKLCDEHINNQDNYCNPRVYQIMEETNQLKDLAINMESTWSRLEHNRPLQPITMGNIPLINNNGNIYINEDQSNYNNDIVIGQDNAKDSLIKTDQVIGIGYRSKIPDENTNTEEATYNLDLYDTMTPINFMGVGIDQEQVDEVKNKNQTKPNRLTKENSSSIEELEVKGNLQDCAFTLDDKVQDTENPAQSVGSDQEKIKSIINECKEILSKRIKSPSPSSVAPLPQNDDLGANLSPLSEKKCGGGKITLEDGYRASAAKKLAFAINSKTPEELNSEIYDFQLEVSKISTKYMLVDIKDWEEKTNISKLWDKLDEARCALLNNQSHKIYFLLDEAKRIFLKFKSKAKNLRKNYLKERAEAEAKRKSEYLNNFDQRLVCIESRINIQKLMCSNLTNYLKSLEENFELLKKAKEKRLNMSFKRLANEIEEMFNLEKTDKARFDLMLRMGEYSKTKNPLRTFIRKRHIALAEESAKNKAEKEDWKIAAIQSYEKYKGEFLTPLEICKKIIKEKMINDCKKGW